MSIHPSMFKKYSWIPAGLTGTLAEKFFRLFPKHQQPLNVGDHGADGDPNHGKFWENLFIKQYPLVDVSLHYCLTARRRSSHNHDLDGPGSGSGTGGFDADLLGFLMENRNQKALEVAIAGQIPANNQLCGYCNCLIKRYSMAVYCTLLDPAIGTFHPNCFRCQTCKQLLAFHIYCVHKNRIYCERHYMELFLPRCSACDELIVSSETKKDSSQTWHMEHFNCVYCQKSLANDQYVLTDQEEKKPVCITCFEQQNANVCEECQKPIGVNSKDLSFNDRHWHEQCFVCSECKKDLYEKPFGNRSDHIYCGECYDEKFAPRCCKCGQLFQTGQQKLDYRDEMWHADCFRCKKCQLPIGLKTFLPKDNDVYCSECYEDTFAHRCSKCSQIITSDVVEFHGKLMHSDCLRCTECQTGLSSIPFLSRDERPYCRDCHANLFARKCFKCTKPITGSTGSKMITHENRHWHLDCFKCHDCQTNLQGKGFINDGLDDIYCSLCAKDKLAAQLAKADGSGGGGDETTKSEDSAPSNTIGYDAADEV